VTGFGNDTVALRDGTIGGNIGVSGGTDSLTVLGGTVGGDILASFGDDAFTWEGGGIVSLEIGDPASRALAGTIGLDIRF
jgi:autotransporter family porin